MIRIITDSAADFEPAELEKLNIHCIPLSVQIGEAVYHENVDLSKAQFYALLSQSGALPKTSQPALQAVLDLYEEAKASGDQVIHITLSSAISGTYQSALSVRNMVEFENCYIVDSRNATGGQRMLVEYAVKLRDEGYTAEEIVEAVKGLRDRVVLYACMDTLEYLYLGGRISHTVYKLGSMAQIKPIIRVDEQGGIEVPAKAMGMRKGMDILCKKPELLPPDPDFPIYVMYTGDRSNGEKLAQKLTSLGYPIPDGQIINVGAAIGSHVGPGACGIVYITK